MYFTDTQQYFNKILTKKKTQKKYTPINILGTAGATENTDFLKNNRRKQTKRKQSTHWNR